MRSDAARPIKIAAAARKSAKHAATKNDPRHVAAARELRDRYLEEVNSAGRAFLPEAAGKYDMSRLHQAAPTRLNPATPLLKAA